MPLFVALILLALLICGLIVRDIRCFRRFPSLDARAKPTVSSLVSIIVPARNEANNIVRCLDGALAQSYSNYEVIVVDDGSTDDTPRILARYAAQHPTRLRIICGCPLPKGWVGKCNACLHGANNARGDWVLFVDADTVPQPTLVMAMMAYAEAERLDVLTSFPFNELSTLAERLVLPVFFQFAFTAFPLQKIISPEPPPNSAMANGQCLLVRASAYWALGGHEAVKDKVLEDIEFAQAFRRAGYRLAVTTAFDQMRVRMYRNLGEIVQGLGKHASAGRRASGGRAFWSVLRLSLTLFVPPFLVLACLYLCLGWLALMGGSLLAWLALAASAWAYATSLWFWAQRYRAWYALPITYAFLAPIGWIIYLFIVARGTLQTLFKRGVVWKDRVYS